METLIYDISIIIINLLDFKDKINLYKTSKKYDFVLSCINYYALLDLWKL